MTDPLESRLLRDAEAWRTDIGTTLPPSSESWPQPQHGRRTFTAVAAAVTAVVAVIGLSVVLIISRGTGGGETAATRPTISVAPPASTGGSTVSGTGSPWDSSGPPRGVLTSPTYTGVKDRCPNSSFSRVSNVVSPVQDGATLTATLRYQGAGTCNIDLYGPWVMLFDVQGVVRASSGITTFVAYDNPAYAITPGTLVRVNVRWSVACSVRLGMASVDVSGVPGAGDPALRYDLSGLAEGCNRAAQLPEVAITNNDSLQF